MAVFLNKKRGSTCESTLTQMRPERIPQSVFDGTSSVQVHVRIIQRFQQHGFQFVQSVFCRFFAVSEESIHIGSYMDPGATVEPHLPDRIDSAFDNICRYARDGCGVDYGRVDSTENTALFQIRKIKGIFVHIPPSSLLCRRASLSCQSFDRQRLRLC
jgi:hypothetical protein